MENIYWKKTVGTLIGAIWLYTLAGIAASITGVVNGYLNPSGVMGMIKDMMEGGSGAPSLSMADVIESMFSILMLVGYYLFFRSLTRFARLQSNWRDGEKVSTVRTAYILLVVALLVDFVPMIGGLASFVLMVIAYVKMLSGYRGLKKSATFPPEARQGASTLFACTIWTLVGYVLGCIPLIGSVIEGIITFVVFFTILSAWGRIKNAAPEMTPEEEEAYKRDEVPAYKQILGDALIIFFFMGVANAILSKMFPLQEYITSSPWCLGGYYLFWSVVEIAIWMWLLFSSKARLNLGAKVGIGILLLGNITYVLFRFFETRINVNFQLIDSIERAEAYSRIVPIHTAAMICCSIGILLFIWFTAANLSIKTTVTSYIIMMRLFWDFFYKMQIEALIKNDSVTSEAINRFSSACSWINIGIVLITFILVYYFVSRWRQKPFVKQQIIHYKLL